MDIESIRSTFLPENFKGEVTWINEMFKNAAGNAKLESEIQQISMSLNTLTQESLDFLKIKTEKIKKSEMLEICLEISEKNEEIKKTCEEISRLENSIDFHENENVFVQKILKTQTAREHLVEAIKSIKSKD